MKHREPEGEAPEAGAREIEVTPAMIEAEVERLLELPEVRAPA